MIDLAAALCAAAAVGGLSYLYLISAAYSPAMSMLCAVLAAGQTLVALTTATVTSLLLALLVYPIAAGAAAFADVKSLRNVVLLSGALALVQTVNPLGTAMAAILVPVLIVQDGIVFRSRGVSLLVLLLFIPAGSAAILAYRAYTMNPGIGAQVASDVAQFAVYRPSLEFTDFRVQALARVAELAAIGLPVWITAALVRSRASIAIATVCAALIVAVTVAAFLGRPRPVAVVAPAFAIPSVLALREWPQARRTANSTIMISALGVLLTWLCAELAA
jgi:hypothetical protein